MKNVTKLTALLAAIIISALSVSARAPIAAQRPAGVVASANDVQLVIEGKVIGVHDGDTVTVLDQANKKFTIRLQGIDAPELKQEFGAVSQKNLSSMVLGKQVTIVWNKVDKYRRTVGTIMLDGRDINIEQVKAGVAWHFKKYEDEQSPADRVTYAAAEQSARAAKLGLWQAASPLAPGDWRQEAKTKRWGPPPPEGTIIGNGNSKKYHRPDCSGYRDMAERNRVFFKTVAEAEAAGYKRAGNCPAEVVVAKSSTAPAGEPVYSGTATAEASKAGPIKSPSLTVEPKSKPSLPIAATKTADPVSTSNPAPSKPAKPVYDQSPLKIIGNKNSKIFHQPWCSGYERVSEKNRAYFNNGEEAEKAGYRLAKNCSGTSPY